MSARTCLPIRQQRDTLALLWVLDDGRPLDLVESRIARACGDRLRTLLGPAEAADPSRLLARFFTGGAPPDVRGLLRRAPPAGLLQFAVVGHRTAVGRAPSAVLRPAASSTVVGTAQVDGRRLVLTARSTTAQSDVVRDLLPTHRSPGWVVGYSAAFEAATTEPGTVATLAVQAIVAADCAAIDPALSATTGWLDLGLYRQLLLTAQRTGPVRSPSSSTAARPALWNDLHRFKLEASTRAGTGNGPLDRSREQSASPTPSALPPDRAVRSPTRSTEKRSTAPLPRG
jgi:hypothetical protein